MTINSNEAIKRILNGICDLTLPKHEWTHEAHFAAAIAMLSDTKFQAFNDMPYIIRTYNEATGISNTDNEGYHHTITIASLLATRAILFDGFPSMLDALNRIITSEYGRSDWLLSYWSKEVLFSIEARKVWVSPNVKTLPFSLKQS